ncbi:hypothetical protein SFUMM280S_11512 [Streptomyces fumanus]
MALSSGSDTEGAGAAFRRQPLLSPHNMYLLVLAEQGLLGLLALAGSWAALLVCALRRAALAGSGPIGCGLLVWHLVDFAYGDIGGPVDGPDRRSRLGLAARWAAGRRAAGRGRGAGGGPGAAAYGGGGRLAGGRRGWPARPDDRRG